MKNVKLISLGLAAVISLTGHAYAAHFTQGVISAPSTQFYFDYATKPSPIISTLGTSFELTADVCDYNTQSGYECSPDTLTFYSAAAGGGFGRIGGYLVDIGQNSRYFGDVMYAGLENAPTFLNGTYQVSTDAGDGEFTISRAASATPEMSTWAMLLIGFAAVGATARRRSIFAQNRVFAKT